MPIIAAEIKMYRSAVVNDGGTNGGRMSNIIVTDNVKNNLWPDVSSSERAAGSTKYRKTFIKFENAAGLAAITPKVFLEDVTTGDDRMAFFAGTHTQTDVQSGIGSPRLYGAGRLNANVSIGATSITVLVEAAADALFLNGDTLRISDKTFVDSVTGNEEYITVTGTVTYAGNVATIPCSALVNAYTAAAPTKVSSVYAPGTIQPTVSAPVKTSVSGIFNLGNTGGNPIVEGPIGGVYDTWTLTFSSATAFSVTGTNTGSVGSGTTGSNFAPNNPAFSSPYFTIPSAAWTGTWATGNTVTFTTTPSAIPIWMKRVVPAAAASLSGNLATLSIDTESA